MMSKSITYIHHGWRKFWISIVGNAPKWKIWASSLQIIFIMVEENFGFQLSEMLRDEEFEYVHYIISSSTMLKIFCNDLAQILHFGAFPTIEIQNFLQPWWWYSVISLLKWRKFWISVVWNAPKWRIWVCSLQSIFSIVEENFEFQLLEMLQNERFWQNDTKILKVKILTL